MLTTLELCLESYGVIHISDASRVLGIPIRPLLIYGEAPHDVSGLYCVLVVFVYCIDYLYLLKMVIKLFIVISLVRLTRVNEAK